MKKGQVTIFIILAIVIVSAIVLYFALRSDGAENISSDLVPVYDYYLSCVEATAKEGVVLLGEQGGHIETPDFVPGSQYAPFSSQLDFLGQPVPYWMYVSGNNLLREQIPTKGEMEGELETYIEDRLQDCDFESFELAGYDVYVDEGSVDVQINEMSVDVDASNSLTIFYGEQSAIVDNYDFSLTSKLGKFYEMAVGVYNFEKTDMFLEQYALDVMRLYAPVAGTELSCVPKIFIDEEIREDIVGGLAANIPAMKLTGDYYELADESRNYFVTDSGLNIDENMNFMYSPDWPTKIEIYGDKVVSPIGLQEGLGILGFCYVPYQLIYDISFPVMIQFYDNEEVFQFPVAVIISKNQAREAVPTTTGSFIASKVCEFKNQEVDIYTYDIDLNPVEARVQFKCLDAVCEIGETELEGVDAVFSGELPQCVNGFILASAEGYADAKYQISTNEESVANIIMNKKYKVDLYLGDVDKALVTFRGEEYSTTALYPDMDSVELVEDYYNVTVYVYDNSSLKFPAINKRECVDVPESGLAGLFGSETEKCYDINIPEMDISFAVVGGGSAREYILAGVLEDSTELNINVPLFGAPANTDDLQENNLRVEDELIYLEFE